jgi:hypothetical protein
MVKTALFKARFQTRRFLWEFPIGSYVKLSSALVAILVEVLKCRTQFWKKDHPRISIRQRRPVSKMATVTKNRNFFKWSKLLYLKPECA